MYSSEARKPLCEFVLTVRLILRSCFFGFRADQLRMGPLQADFNDANIILPGKPGGPLGVIDFGDIVHSWVVNDIAIATAYATVSCGNFDVLLGAFPFLADFSAQCQPHTRAGDILYVQVVPMLIECGR